MTEDSRMPNFWWCPTHHLYRGGDTRPCASAVRLVPAPPAPRVFLPGDEVPVGTVITAKNGSPFRVPDAHTSHGMARVGVPFVEVAVPSLEEWQAAVDRAHAALGGPALTTDAELRALTPDQLEACIHRALEAGDIQAVEGYLLLMAPQNPGRAQDLMNTLKVGLNLAKEQQP